MTYTIAGENYEVKIEKSNYFTNGNLAVLLTFDDGEEDVLTVNLEEKLPLNQAYVDTNNHPNAEQFIIDNNLGEPLGKYGHSGFCAYPLYKFY